MSQSASNFPEISRTGGSEPSRAARQKVNVVLFSGGSGTHSITQSLMQHTQLELKILINAYDDGHSTGRLRRFLPGMLGPSDVRKNIARLMPVRERNQKALKKLSDERLPVGISREDALRVVGGLAGGRLDDVTKHLADAYLQLSVVQARRLRTFLELFLTELKEVEATGGGFDFTDCAVGNLLFAGCYLEQGRSFNRTMRAFAEFYEVDPDVLLDVTQGENLFLVAEKEDGTILRNEADIVAAQSEARITELFLIGQDVYRNQVEAGSLNDAELAVLLREKLEVPVISPEAAAAIAVADVIVYGPGTQHSSLFPSYMTRGVSQAIAANQKADKIFIGNIHRDLDIQQDGINDLAVKFLAAMNAPGEAKVEWTEVVTQFFVQHTESGADKAKYIPFDAAAFPFAIETVRLRDWEGHDGRGHHAGGFVMDELMKIVQSRIDIELESLQHMVSIVIPVLNEEATMGQVLDEVSAMDLQSLNLTKEIIVIDGGSSDRTAAIAGMQRGVKVFTLPPNWPKGRGAAMRYGMEKSRGNLIVFYPGDDEYSVNDLGTVIASLVRSPYRAVFGTRSVKIRSLTEHLRKIYADNPRLYLTSKYGGIMLSVLTLLLYNRYVTDVLTSVKGFDAKLLRELNLELNGRDLETEIVAKLALRNEFILELPVDYNPRTRAAGKKITIGDGVGALWSLVKNRL